MKLGEKMTDTITGVTGIATQRMEYLHRCTLVLLEWGEGGMQREFWVDEPRLRPADKKPCASVAPIMAPGGEAIVLLP